ncbi:AraC family transcriptional regulator [Vibrio penaeicida]|uniref:AraC family transcriptional regulator n=1 Tax=Vibrio penaeicida TaxID=104609 RepID=A0AAV5NY57_9VIBR|nr:AraC family transcriptional regulator [Vibrio penaeicida]RTZ21004.1 AraC family transcriptional regulator [Vibrio penaeicida]GLQ75318.1 AraC family transcriptional regulator [Vibrio penaeicida]
MSVTDPSLNRIEKLLSYIHSNVDLPLTLEDLSKQSCWSRWQLQRVFHSKTGLNVAQYVREIKLSLAAEQILTSHDRMVDISVAFGFNSEISFSRAFKQYFGLSPRAYRQQGNRNRIKIPLVRPSASAPRFQPDTDYFQIRIEHRAASTLYGIREPIKGLFAQIPNFKQKVPQIWEELHSKCKEVRGLSPQLGVIDATHSVMGEEGLEYWSGLNAEQLSERTKAKLSSLDIPEHDYAVLPVHGPIEKLADLVEWFILFWLPDSGYQGVDGYEIEVYDHRFNATSDTSYMEYWFPVIKN